jgi:hypothetical protein
MEASSEIREFVERYYAAARAGHDADAKALISQREGVLMIGSDPREWWDGAGFARAMRAQAEEVGGSIPIYAGDVQAFREGSVSWAADRPTFRMGEGREIPARISMVMHLEGDAWKIVHLHLSVGVANEDTVGQELTI